MKKLAVCSWVVRYIQNIQGVLLCLLEVGILRLAETISGLGWVAILFSVVGIVASVIVKNKPKLAGIMFLVAGIGGLICISMAYILPAILLIIAGIMALVRKESAQNSKAVNN